ncbi:MAG: DNA sulfur modification protein DndB [Candidatus Dadabacteria bacterium]|nr:DNA sulfur modification protein DndB [Candidatus Dadabacteria bacterium]
MHTKLYNMIPNTHNIQFLMFDATRGTQAGREFYVTTCDFATVVKHFAFDKDTGVPPEMRAQRRIRMSRISRIATYILENPNDYVFSAITVSVDWPIRFDPVPPNDPESSVGVVVIPANATILVNDGQHRCAAIRSAYEENRNTITERIPVVMFEDLGLKHSQQMFADLNQNAVKPTKSLALLYDHRDTFARFVVTLAEDVDIFAGRTEMEKTNISNRSTSVFTLNGIGEATRRLLGIKMHTKSIAAEKQRMAVEYWTHVARNIPQWNLLMEKKITAYEMRRQYVHAHTNMLNALGMAGHILLEYKDWKQKIRKLQGIDWSRSSPIWQNKVVMDGRMLKNRLGIKRAANEILSLLGLPDRVDDGI